MSEAQGQPTIDLGRLAPGLSATCGEYLGRYSAGLEEAVRGGEGGLTVARRRSTVVDGLLSSLFCAADGAARATGVSPTGRVALVAVGSYGRNTLSLHSDLDVIFLCDDPDDPHLAALAEGILYPLWDVGIQVGHAVRGLSETLELAQEDISTATTLLDLRRVAGNAEIVSDLLRDGTAAFSGAGLMPFLRSLHNDTRERHERFGGSLYLLEPEVKLGRGGLRDVDVGIWAARACWDVADLAGLVECGAMRQDELEGLEVAREFQWRVRNLMHLHAGRTADRLTFEEQEDIAGELGFVDGVSLGVEQFMQSYYRHARTVATVMERLYRRAAPTREVDVTAPVGLARSLAFRNGELGFADPEALRKDPVLALELYEQVAQHQLPPEQDARDAVTAVSEDPEWTESLRGARGASELFLKLIAHIDDVPLRQNSLLGELHEVGLLLAMIPEFEALTGRVQHDVYHVYTVDVHTIAAVDRLRAYIRGDMAEEQPLASRTAAENVRMGPLFLGLLLHDIGKTHGKDHARQGALMARPIAERFGLTPRDVEHVVWLVGEHLSLYLWATRRDTSDPEALAEFAESVGSVGRLRDLYLLTFADLSTTNPKAMTGWKAAMLGELYISASSVLDGGTTDGSLHAAEIRHEVRVGFVGDAGQAELDAFVATMPDRYVLAHPVDVIRAHARAVRDRGESFVHVTTFPGPSADVTEFLVVTDDKPGLLASMAAALNANRFEIAGAEIYDRTREGAPREACDLFYLRRGGEHVDDIEWAEWLQVAQDIEALMLGKTTGEALLAKRLPKAPSWAVRKGPDVATKVATDDHTSSRYTVVDVYAKNHMGLLYAISKTLYEDGLTIALSKINTEGQKVADVFYVERAEGGKIEDPKRAEALRERLHQVIQESLAARL